MSALDELLTKVGINKTSSFGTKFNGSALDKLLGEVESGSYKSGITAYDPKPITAPEPIVVTPEKPKTGIIAKAKDLYNKVAENPRVKSVLTEISRRTSGTGIQAMIKAASPEVTFTQAYEALRKSQSEGDDTLQEQFVTGLKDTLPQTALGIGLAFVPVVGVPLATTYWSAVSAGSEIEEKGKFTPTNVAIDVIGDRMLGGVLEKLLKTPTKTLLSTVKKAFVTEGGTEVGQDLAKFANEYRLAKTDEERKAIIDKAKAYFTSGQILVTAGVGGVSGGGIAATAQTIAKLQVGESIPVPPEPVAPEPATVVTPNADTSGFAERVAQAKVGETISLDETPVTTPIPQKQSTGTRKTIKAENLPSGVKAIATIRPDGTAGISIHIDKELRGQGFGTQALKQLEEKLIAQGIKTVKPSVDMHIGDGEQSSVGFFEKNGYKKNGDPKGGFQPMIKELSPKTKDLSTLNAEFGTENSKKIREAALDGKYENRRLSGPQQLAQVDLGVANPTPDSQVTVYRGGKGEIKAGDFVTTRLDVAEKYVADRPGSSLFQETVAAKDLLIHIKGKKEFIYAPKESVKEQKPEPKPEPEKEVPKDQEVVDASVKVQEAIYSGDIEAAKELYDSYKDLKLPSFDELQSQVEEYQDGVLNEVQEEMGNIENLEADSPERTIIEVAQRLGKYFRAPGTVRRFTGNKRTYTDSKGNSVTVGGTFTDAMDRLIFAPDIDGFGKVMGIMHEKYNTAFTELSDMIKKGQIDGADYEKFKSEFKKLIDSRPTYSARSRKGTKPSGKVESTKAGEEATKRVSDQPSSVEDYSGLLKRQIGDVFEMVEPTSGLWQSKGNVLYLRLTGNRRGVGGPSWLQNQSVVEKVQEAGGKDVLKVTMKKMSAPSGYANTDKFIEDSKTQKDESAETRKIIEFPEMIKLVKQITGKLPQLRKMRIAGRFNPITEAITINRDIFANEKQAARTLAHEIGHLVDFLDKEAKTMSRGNLLGRLASLRGYRKQFISDEPPAERDLITPEDRKALMKRARELAKEPVEVTKTIVVGEVKIEPSEVLAIWRDNTAGEKDPDLMKYIQTLADSDKVDIAKAALKGIIPDWVKFTRKKLETITVKEIRRAPADIRAKYKDLVREEIKKRRLVSLAVVRKELKDLSHVWRPLSRTDADYMKYRNSGAELYADAISVLFNDPVRLQESAPVFYRTFFNYLSNKPKVSEAFFDAWHLLNKGEDAVLTERLNMIDKMFKDDEAKFRAIQEERANVRRDIAFELKESLVNKNQAVLDKVKQAKAKGIMVADEENPKYLLSGYNYLPGKIKAFLDEQINPWYSKLAEQGLTWDDVGKAMMLERIMDERKNIANPLGFTKDTAKPTYDRMMADLGEEKAKALKESVEKFRAANKLVMEQAYTEGELYTEDLYKQIKGNNTYASFRVTEYLENNVSAKIFKQVGTFKDIGNPATATLAKMIATIRATERSKINHSVVKLLNQGFKEDIKIAPTKWNGRTQVAVESRDPKEALIFNYEKGKAVGYYVDPYIASAINFMPSGELNVVLKLLNFVNNKLYQPAFITYNLGFQVKNFKRDFKRLWKNTPGLSPLPVLKAYLKAIPASAARASGAVNETISKMEKGEMLSITYNDLIKGMTEEDQQIDTVMSRYYGLKDQTKNPVLKLLNSTMSIVEWSGNFVETLPKVAGYLEMQDKLSPEALSYFVRNMAGSPDFLTRGSLYATTNNLMLFSNAMVQGTRADIEIATDPKTRAGYWFKTAMVDLLPKLLMYMAVLGLFGKQVKKAYDNISEYQKTQYNPIAIGFDENGKTVALRAVSDENGVLIGGLFWKLLNINREKPLEQGLKDIFSFLVGRIPGVGPAINLTTTTAQYLSGQNPYDTFRGRNVLTDDQFAAGGMYSLVPFLKWQFKQNGGSIFSGSSVVENNTQMGKIEKIVNVPGFSGALQSILFVSDYGQTELNKARANMELKREARIRLDNKDRISEAVKQVSEGKDKRQALNDLINEVKGSGPINQDIINQMQSVTNAFNLAVIKGKNDPNINSLIYATTNSQKAAILTRIKENSSDDEYNSILREALVNKIISEDVLIKVRGL